jgi:hypothetical protein
MSTGKPILVQAFGSQYSYANIDELLTGVERLETRAKLLWKERPPNSSSVSETAIVVSRTLETILAHLDFATDYLNAEDQAIERECAEIDRLFGEL